MSAHESPKPSSNIPKVESEPVGIPVVGGAPADKEYKGHYVELSSGEPFALAIVEDEPNGRTHFAKNSVHFWNGTKAEFAAQFEKK